MRNLRLYFLLGLLLVAGTSCKPTRNNYTVIISLDGTRWDYTDYYDTPFFDSLATIGVAARMEPSYPASTFPNHYTLATGLVPDHNGLVNNSFWDPGREYKYTMGDSVCRYDPYFYGGEPVWVTAQRQGVKTGNVYWVGSDIAIKGEYPTYYRVWDEDPHWSFEERVDEIVRLMSLPEEERPRLVMGYFDEPDHTGHVYGPITPETKGMVEHMDSLMHSLYLRLKALPYSDKINFIVLSDHGMEEISPERFIGWYDVIPESWTERIIANTPHQHLRQRRLRGQPVQPHLRHRAPERVEAWRSARRAELRHFGTPGRPDRCPGPGLAVCRLSVQKQGRARLQPQGAGHDGDVPCHGAGLQDGLRGTFHGRRTERLPQRGHLSPAV